MAEMTLMMQRLCEAARKGADAEGFQMFPDVQESVVTVVLTEMKTALAEAAASDIATLHEQQRARYGIAAINDILGATP